MRNQLISVLKFFLTFSLLATNSQSFAGLIEDYNSNVNNRCGDSVVSVAECPGYQEAALHGAKNAAGQVIVAGCINQGEYDFAQAQALAPQCSTIIQGKYVGWCRCGCFEEGTEILSIDKNATESKMVKVEDINRLKSAQDVVTLREASSLADIQLDRHAIEATTVGDETKDLVIIYTESGQRLGLTEQHAVLFADGRMIAAVNVKVGDEMVLQTGAADKVEKIERRQTAQQVYNLLTKASIGNKYGHLVIANGLIVGDIAWQNTLSKELGKIAMRR